MATDTIQHIDLILSASAQLAANAGSIVAIGLLPCFIAATLRAMLR